MAAWIAAFALAQALDAGTTCAAFARGGIEANPVMPGSCKASVGVKAAVTVGYGFALRPLFKTHPRAARVLTGTLSAVTVGVALHNHRTGR